VVRHQENSPENNPIIQDPEVAIAQNPEASSNYCISCEAKGRERILISNTAILIIYARELVDTAALSDNNFTQPTQPYRKDICMPI
jgi:hypothetical protein